MTVYVARHGETVWNVEGRMQGRRGASLNERGRAQATRLGQVASELHLTRIVTSPLFRALETCRLVLEHVNGEFVTADALMEIDFGACTGMTEVEIEQSFPGLTAARKLDKWNHGWPAGESYAQASARLRAAMRTGALPLADETLVIAHQSVNRALVHVLSDLSPNEALGIAQRSDVLLRVDRERKLSHALIPAEPTEPLVWVDGPYLGRTRLN
jgi:broad specificity phosphatase PhoE